MKLALALLALSTVPFAYGQTTSPAPVSHTTTSHAAASHTGTSAHHTSSTSAKTTSAIPHVAGIPKTLYALKYIDIKIGTGPLAVPQKFYTVHYTGWFPDGKKFDSSVDRGEPITFPYGAKRVITGWDTGFEGMHVGGKRRLFIPYQLAYGILGNPAHGMPAKSNLIFDVELLGISDTPPAPPTPAAKPAPAPAPAPARPTGQEPQPAATPNPAAEPNAKPTTDPAAPKPPAQSSTPPPSM